MDPNEPIPATPGALAPEAPSPRRVKRRLMAAVIALNALSLLAGGLLVVKSKSDAPKSSGKGKSLLELSPKESVGWVTVRGPIFTSENGKPWEKGAEQIARRIEQMAAEGVTFRTGVRVGTPVWRQTNASRYIRMFQARRSLLVWKVFGARTDGWSNDDFPHEAVPGDPDSLQQMGQPVPNTKANLDRSHLIYNGNQMPPPEACRRGQLEVAAGPNPAQADGALGISQFPQYALAVLEESRTLEGQ